MFFTLKVVYFLLVKFSRPQVLLKWTVCSSEVPFFNVYLSKCYDAEKQKKSSAHQYKINIHTSPYLCTLILTKWENISCILQDRVSRVCERRRNKQYTQQNQEDLHIVNFISSSWINHRYWSSVFLSNRELKESKEMPECRGNQDQRACRAALWVQTPTQPKYIDYQSRCVVTAMRPPVLLHWVMDGRFVCLPGRQRWDGTWWWEGESLTPETNSPQRTCCKTKVIAAQIREFLDVCSFRFNPRTGSINLYEQSERKHSLLPHYQHWGALEQGTQLHLFQWPTDQAVSVLDSFQVCWNVIMTDNKGTAVRETHLSEYKKHYILLFLCSWLSCDTVRRNHRKPTKCLPAELQRNVIRVN